MFSEEIRTRLDLLPQSLLILATRRVDADLRAELLEEWSGELHEILRGTEAKPVTRLCRGVRYSMGLLVVAPRVGRTLGRLIRRRAALFKKTAEMPPVPVMPSFRLTPKMVAASGVQMDEYGLPQTKEDLLQLEAFLRGQGLGGYLCVLPLGGSELTMTVRPLVGPRRRRGRRQPQAK
jgi:hypothetical protein